ncbi:hypothetical protein Tco_0433034 [Tanacetum coccineum]
MLNLKFANTHNMVAFLEKPAESAGFEEIVDFLNAQPIRYALTVNSTIYTSFIKQFWATTKAKIVNKEVQIHALLTLMGYEKLSQKLTLDKACFSPQWKFLVHTILQCLSDKTTAWNEFSSTIASAIICLAKNQKFNFSKYIFESMVKNLDNVDEAINEEMDDSLVRAATTTSRLEEEQDSGGGLMHQDTIEDTISQTSFENVSKTSNDSLLVGFNTPQSNEDRLQLKKLMELYTTLQQRVIDLENAKTAQAQEITSLKLRVKRLEKKRGSRTYKLKRLYKVGLSRRVESSKDESLGVLDDEEVFAGLDETRNMAKKEVSTSDPVTTAGEVVTTASVKVRIITEVEITLAQTFVELKSAKSKADKVVKQELEQDQVQEPTPTVSLQQSSHVKDKGKAKMVKPEHVKKMSKKDQIMLEEELALKLQAKEEEEERLATEKAQQVKETNISWDNVQAMIDDDYQMAQILQS